MFYKIKFEVKPHSNLPESELNFYEKSSGYTFKVRNKKDIKMAVNSLLGHFEDDAQLPSISYYDFSTLSTTKHQLGVYKGTYKVPDLTLKLVKLKDEGYCEITLQDILQDNPQMLEQFSSFSIKIYKN